MIVAIVPALDEAEHIAAVVSGLPPCVDRIVVVDDGSSDGTGELARGADPRVEVVRHATRHGVGRAIASGVRAAHDADIAFVVAGDGQMDPRDLPALLSPIEGDRADFVKGNRLAWPGGALSFPLTRLVGVVAISAATRVITGLPINDSPCGYVAFGRRALLAIDWDALWPSFGYPSDLLARVGALGLRIEEVPVRPIYNGAGSHLRPHHVPGMAFVLARALIARACRAS